MTASRRACWVPSAWAASGALAVALAAAPACAATWTFASDSPLLLGGSITGQFTGTDTNADQFIGAAEVTAFSVSYAGAPPATTSFSIGKSMLDASDSFSLDLLGGSFSFGVFDSLGQSISGGNQEFSTVVATGFYDAGSSLNLSAVPEPGTVSLWATGLALLGVARRKRGWPRRGVRD